MFAAALVTHNSALAQTEAEFIDAFSGDWQIYDDIYGDNGLCRIKLFTERDAAGLTLKPESCALELGEITHWEILDGQLALKIGPDIVATLGGNQQRMSGNMAIGSPVILERLNDSALVTQLASAHAASGCYYLGFTNTCANDDQLGKPTPPGDGSGASINVLVNLNVRVEARDEADILGVVSANSCIITDICTQASDGVWCRARFGEDLGWLKKVALRQERWPVITFVNQCTATSP